MLQGASIVRFANTKLDAYKEQKNFVFVAIYIDNSGKVDRYLFYQDEKIDPDNPEYVRIHVRYLSQNLLLNRRRSIGSFERSISTMQTSARDLLLNCTTSLLHGVTINAQKKKSKNSRPLSRMLWPNCHRSSSGPSVLPPILRETHLGPRVIGPAAQLVAQLDNSKTLDMKSSLSLRGTVARGN